MQLCGNCPCYNTTLGPLIVVRCAMEQSIRKLAIVPILLALIATIICVRIELLNRQAGSMLPRSEYRNGDPAQGLVQWRLSPITSEAAWRKVFGAVDENRQPIPRSLTDTERRRMREYIERTKASNRLRDVITSYGVFQYLIVFVGLLWSIVVLFRKPNRIEKAFLALSVGLFLLSASSMFYRGYFTSLGS